MACGVEGPDHDPLCEGGACDDGEAATIHGVPAASFYEQFTYFVLEDQEAWRHHYLHSSRDLSVFGTTGEFSPFECRVGTADLFLLEDQTYVLRYQERYGRRSGTWCLRDGTTVTSEVRVEGQWSPDGRLLSFENLGLGEGYVDGTGSPRLAVRIDTNLVTAGLEGQVAHFEMTTPGNLQGLEECSGTAASDELCPIPLPWDPE